MVTTRRRAREASPAQPDQAGSSPPADADNQSNPPRVPWYHWTEPESEFELHPDEDADLPVPLVFYIWIGGVIGYLAWSVFIGQPPWPPVTYDC